MNLQAGKNPIIKQNLTLDYYVIVLKLLTRSSKASYNN